MFQQKTSEFGRFTRRRVWNEATGHALSAAPDRGGCLLELQLGGHQLLDAYQTPAELDANRWAKNMLLFPFPNRLRDGAYEWQGKTYHFPINEPNTETALHGMGMDCRFQVKRADLQADFAELELVYEDEGQHPGYPFPFTFSVVFRLDNRSTVGVSMNFKNQADQAIPVALGWHPYFHLDGNIDGKELQLPRCELVGIDQRMLPTGRRYRFTDYESPRRLGSTILDNCFAVAPEEGSVNIHLRGRHLALHYWQETGAGKFNFFQLFTPPDRNAIAIEPMTGNIDAFNTGDGLIRLAPGEQASASFGFSLERLK